MGFEALRNGSRSLLYGGILLGTGCTFAGATFFLVQELILRYSGNSLVERSVRVLESDASLTRLIGGAPLIVFGPSDGRHRRPQFKRVEGQGKDVDASIEALFYVQGPQEQRNFAIVRAKSSLVS